MSEQRIIENVRVPVPVQPAMLRGRPDHIVLMSCVKCGAFVDDIVLHEDWHLAGDRR